MPFYAVYRGIVPGVYQTWEEAVKQIKQFSKPIYKKFDTYEEAKLFSESGKILQKSHPIICQKDNDEAVSSKNNSATTKSSTTKSSAGHNVGSTDRTRDTSSGKKNTQTEEFDFIVYTDGACSNNGSPSNNDGSSNNKSPSSASSSNSNSSKTSSSRGGGHKLARGGYGVYFERLPNNFSKGPVVNISISKPFKDPPITNQRAELKAIIEAIKKVDDLFGQEYSILIRSDSLYSINCITVWITNWIKNGWKNSQKEPVKNKEMIVEAYTLINERSGTVAFEHVKGHAGNKGNEMADKLAVAGALLA